VSHLDEKIEKGFMQTRVTKSPLELGNGFRGEAVCLIVYSDKDHVEYIYSLLFQLEKVLEDRGFNPQRLGDEIRSSEDYLETLEKMVDNCALSIVILDGFRPNVLFEFGYIKARKKPIVILQSTVAQINIKTLYREIKDSGLTPTQFSKRLCNPKLDVSLHLSDFAGKHISYTDWRAKDTDPLHPSRVLLKEIQKKRKEIIEETVRVKTKTLPKTLQTEMLEPIIEVIGYYHSGKSEVPIDYIGSLYSKIKDLTKTHNIKPPIEIYDMISTIYIKNLGEKHTVSEAIVYLTSAKKINDDILNSISLKENEGLYASTLMRNGSISLELFDYSNKKEYCISAINTFNEALKIYTPERMKREYAAAQNRIGVAYSKLSDFENTAVNCKKAIKAYNKSLKIVTRDEFPFEYIATKYNLGAAYCKLAEVNNRIENSKKAIEELEKLLGLGKLMLLFSGYYADIQNLLGAAYADIAKVENKKEGYEKAFEAYEEALKHSTLQRNPLRYASIQNNLGTYYGALAIVENRVENCKKAITALNEALKVYTYERFPRDYALTNTNLCEIYHILAEGEDKEINCKKAIEACKEALKVQTRELLPLDYAGTQNNLGVVYVTLAEIKDCLDNYRKAIEAYNEALKIRTFRLLPECYARTQKNLGSVYHNLAKTDDRVRNCRSALKAYKEALRAYMKLGYEQDIASIKDKLEELSELCSN
jgi:tetratricopeptide (TPR) repeat protein